MNWQNKIVFLIIMMCFTVFAANVPDFTAQDLDFQNTSLNALKGDKLTIIDFWATWCKPCIKSIPTLNKIQEQYADKGVKVIGINADSPRNSSKVKPFASTHKISYPILRDPNAKISTELNVVSYPTLFIINNENEIVYTHIGYRSGDEIILTTEIEKLLNEKDQNN